MRWNKLHGPVAGLLAGGAGVGASEAVAAALPGVTSPVLAVANRIIEITPGGVIDKLMSYDDYISSENVAKQREELYAGSLR